MKICFENNEKSRHNILAQFLAQFGCNRFNKKPRKPFKINKVQLSPKMIKNMSDKAQKP